jgi:predicted metal-dependent peptidase
MPKFTTPNLPLLRFKTSLSYPYFSSILFNLIPVEKKNDPDYPTMAVDQHMRIYYNPKFLEQMTLEEGVGVMVHELNHLLRDHLTRGKNSGNNRIWNVAGDCEINDDIIKDTVCGVKLPADHVEPSTFKMKDGEIAEVYFEQLMKKSQKELQKLIEALEKAGYKPGSGKCGSCATGESEPGEEPFEGKDGSGNGNGKDKNGSSQPAGHTKEMVDVYRKLTAEAIVSEASKSRGTIPGYLERWAKAHLRHKVDWKKELKATVRAIISDTIAGMVDYTYRKPRRRQLPNSRFFLPGWHAPIPKIGLITDTSGSISERYLSQAHAETVNILQSVRAEVLFVDVDAEVHFIGVIKDGRQIKYHGGGGTDMRVAYDAISKHKMKPNLIICITDGFTPWPEKEIPGTNNVIVILHEGNTEPERLKEGVPSWAKVLTVRVEDEEGKK